MRGLVANYTGSLDVEAESIAGLSKAPIIRHLAVSNKKPDQEWGPYDAKGRIYHGSDANITSYAGTFVYLSTTLTTGYNDRHVVRDRPYFSLVQSAGDESDVFSQLDQQLLTGHLT